MFLLEDLHSICQPQWPFRFPLEKFYKEVRTLVSKIIEWFNLEVTSELRNLKKWPDCRKMHAPTELTAIKEVK